MKHPDFNPSGTRTTNSTEGKRVSFSYTGKYYLPDTDKKEFFKGIINEPYIVAYTTIRYDKGTYINSTRLTEYDNGFVGHQSFQGFNTLEDAREDYELRKRLTRKYGVHAYCDVFLIEMF